MITKEEYVARRVREMVVSGEMPPGMRIRQQEIADSLGVSATPVREALRRLISEGYLASIPHVGVSVAEVNRDNLEEIYRIRQLLEGFLAYEAAARATPEDIAALRGRNEEFRQASERGDYVEARRVNYRFHAYTWELAAQPVTLQIVNFLWGKFPWNTLGKVSGRDERTLVEHDELIEALAAGDRDRADKALRRHIESGHHDAVTMEDRQGAVGS